MDHHFLTFSGGYIISDLIKGKKGGIRGMILTNYDTTLLTEPDPRPDESISCDIYASVCLSSEMVWNGDFWWMIVTLKF